MSKEKQEKCPSKYSSGKSLKTITTKSHQVDNNIGYSRNFQILHVIFLKLSKKIVKKGGLGEFEVIDMMEWFMKSMIDVLSAIDHILKPDLKYGQTIKPFSKANPSQEWPRLQDAKQLFVNIVKPIEELVAHLFPLPPYQVMR